jgi:hypothetical protein
MISRPRRVPLAALGTAIIVGLIGVAAPIPVFAKPKATAGGSAASTRAAALERRHKFVQLLMARQAKEIAANLAQQHQTLERRAQRLQNLASSPALGPTAQALRNPNSPNAILAREVAKAQQRVANQIRKVDQKIANPPPTPIERRLAAQQQALERRLELLSRRLNRLEGLTPKNPREARLIAQVEQQIRQRETQLHGSLKQLERLSASPTAPGSALNALGL